MRTFLLFISLTCIGSLIPLKVNGYMEDLYLDEDTGSGDVHDSSNTIHTTPGHDVGSGEDPDDIWYDEEDYDYDDDEDTGYGSGWPPSFGPVGNDGSNTGISNSVSKYPLYNNTETEEIFLDNNVGPVEETPQHHMPSSTEEPTLTGTHTEMDNQITILTNKDDDRQVSIFAQPGMLAAFVGGTVLGLLCAILLVMCVVYRMRKRDEGSYPLDEPKRVPLTSSYSPNDKEIYA